MGVAASARVETGIVLAGGQSARMGRPKALLEIGGRRLIDRVVEVLRDLFPEVILVTGAPEPYLSLGLQIVPDALPERRSLVGVYSGLLATSGTHAFVCACDLPFLNGDLIRYMCALLGEQVSAWDAVVPHCRGEHEPLHAVYGKGCLEAMRRTIDAGRRNTAFFGEVRVREVTEDEVARFDPRFLSFVNVNTPGEYEEARRIAAKEDG
ncbi:MAG: molybdenum cofactor guanylyltransferase [Armatimonadetes bacterium]|nr:molybdenum cofactor guanylyltransferase [Armatimonadota bacterium]